jgi:hypothetical protein
VSFLVVFLATSSLRLAGRNRNARRQAGVTFQGLEVQ